MGRDARGRGTGRKDGRAARREHRRSEVAGSFIFQAGGGFGGGRRGGRGGDTSADRPAPATRSENIRIALLLLRSRGFSFQNIRWFKGGQESGYDVLPRPAQSVTDHHRRGSLQSTARGTQHIYGNKLKLHLCHLPFMLSLLPSRQRPQCLPVLRRGPPKDVRRLVRLHLGRRQREERKGRRRQGVDGGGGEEGEVEVRRRGEGGVRALVGRKGRAGGRRRLEFGGVVRNREGRGRGRGGGGRGGGRVGEVDAFILVRWPGGQGLERRDVVRDDAV